MKDECLSKLILFGEASLRRALNSFVEHSHRERNHQETDDELLFADEETEVGIGSIRSGERLAGLLKLYYREAA